MVRQATAVVVEMPGLASTMRAAAGIRNATVWTALRTLVTDIPLLTSPSASKPADMDPSAMTCNSHISELLPPVHTTIFTTTNGEDL